METAGNGWPIFALSIIIMTMTFHFYLSMLNFGGPADWPDGQAKQSSIGTGQLLAGTCREQAEGPSIFPPKELSRVGLYECMSGLFGPGRKAVWKPAFFLSHICLFRLPICLPLQICNIL